MTNRPPNALFVALLLAVLGLSAWLGVAFALALDY